MGGSALTLGSTIPKISENYNSSLIPDMEFPAPKSLSNAARLELSQVIADSLTMPVQIAMALPAALAVLAVGRMAAAEQAAGGADR